MPTIKKKLFRVYFLLALVVGTLLIGPTLIDRFKTTIVEGEGVVEKSAESRIVIIEAQWEMFKNENPIFGNGHRGTLLLSPIYVDEEYMTTKGGVSVRGSHNLIMTILIDHGLIGVFLFLSIPGILFIRFFRMRPFLLKSESLTPDDANILLLYIALNISLVSIWVSSMGVNSLKLEVSIWYYALAGLTYSWLVKIISKAK